MQSPVLLRFRSLLFLPYYITHAEFRYRLLIDPLLTILAAYAFTTFATKSRFGVGPLMAKPLSPPRPLARACIFSPSFYWRNLSA